MLENANPLEWVIERGARHRHRSGGPQQRRGQRDPAAADERVHNADQVRQQAAQALAQARNIPLEEARQQVAAFEQQYQQTVAQAKQAATEAADTAASAISTGALVAFMASCWARSPAGSAAARALCIRCSPTA